MKGEEVEVGNIVQCVSVSTVYVYLLYLSTILVFFVLVVSSSSVQLKSYNNISVYY